MIKERAQIQTSPGVQKIMRTSIDFLNDDRIVQRSNITRLSQDTIPLKRRRFVKPIQPILSSQERYQKPKDPPLSQHRQDDFSISTQRYRDLVNSQQFKEN